MSKAGVSVVIATYQRPQQLAVALQSVRVQTFKPDEVIVVHDGPCDVFPYTNIPDMPKLISTPSRANDWGATPRLTGTRRAKGKYIAYLDDDNEWLPTHLLDLMTTITMLDCDFVFSDDNRHIGNGRPEFSHIDTSTILHKRSLLKSANWRPSGYAADWDLVERWLAAGATWGYTGKATSLYHTQRR